MTAPDKPGTGHNGGPPLDGEPYYGPRTCRWCRHWSAAPASEEQAYEWFRLGLSRRRVRRPTGTCDRVKLAPDKPLAFSASTPEFSCLNFAAKPLPPVAMPRRGGFVTIYEGDKIVWRGTEEDMPAEYRDD